MEKELTPTPLTVKCITFDIGGVLTSDPWETIMLTPDFGLADRLRLDKGTVQKACLTLWREFSISQQSERDYWDRFTEMLNVRPSEGDIADAEKQIWTNKDFAEIAQVLNSRAIDIALISDNTSFWFDKQCSLLPSLASVPDEKRFLSFSLGYRKSSSPISTFDALAQAFNPANTIVIDDRWKHISRARECGFQALHFAAGASPNALKSLIIDLVELIHFDE